MARYSKSWLRLVHGTKDTPAEQASRLRQLAWFERIKEEMAERWPQITPENFEEAKTWQEERLRELDRADWWPEHEDHNTERTKENDR